MYTDSSRPSRLNGRFFDAGGHKTDTLEKLIDRLMKEKLPYTPYSDSEPLINSKSFFDLPDKFQGKELGSIGISGVYIVGSQANGNFRDDSDLDILILADLSDNEKHSGFTWCGNYDFNNSHFDLSLFYVAKKYSIAKTYRDLVELHVMVNDVSSAYPIGLSYDVLNDKWVIREK